MTIPLEDSASDIVGKAQRGLGLDDQALAAKIGVAPDELESIKAIKGAPAEKVQQLAKALKLGARALAAMADGKYQPETKEPDPGFFMANTAYDDMRVNAYLVWDASTGVAAAFDSGGDCTPLLEELQKRELALTDIYLTHTHVDHVVEIDRLREKAGGTVVVHVNEREKIDGAETFSGGETFKLGRLSIESRNTPGHSPGGTSYHVHGLDRPLCIVGDALFAGSAGGIKQDYEGSLKLIRENILSAQEGTVLAPGHGPLTTVIQEKRSNPFFAVS